jgi:hypothetical protein
MLRKLLDFAGGTLVFRQESGFDKKIYFLERKALRARVLEQARDYGMRKVSENFKPEEGGDDGARIRRYEFVGRGL